MVRPAHFGFNVQTAPSNRFQREPQHEPQAGASAQAGRAESAALAQALESAGVRICTVEDTAPPIKPDAVFPNNWVSFHDDGTIVLYPMQAANRRLERRLEVLAAVEHELHFRCRHLLDLSHEEEAGRYLEGTGSLVLDHLERVAYACRSPRTDESLVREWARALRYEAEVFDAAGAGWRADLSHQCDAGDRRALRGDLQRGGAAARPRAHTCTPARLGSGTDRDRLRRDA